MFELYLLIVFMLIGSLIAIETRSMLSAVVAVSVVGFMLCIVFLILGAPDVAITQLIVEVLALVILVRATGVKRDTLEFLTGRRETFALITAIIFTIIFAGYTLYTLKGLPSFGNPLMTVSQYYIAWGQQQAKAVNLVTQVLLDFRLYDTLGEATILFTAIVGALAVLRRKGRKKINERDDINS